MVTQELLSMNFSDISDKVKPLLYNLAYRFILPENEAAILLDKFKETSCKICGYKTFEELIEYIIACKNAEKEIERI